MKVFVVIVLLFCVAVEVLGHGMLLDPPNRSSLWRFVEDAPKNYDDNANFCGGFAVQWGDFDGKCGVCGDPYDESHPQRNENTGAFGVGYVPVAYKSGSVINVHARLTSNHLGTFSYSLCVLDDPTKPEPGEECFQALTLADGSPSFPVTKYDYNVTNQLQLPVGLTCERCVLRWHYTAGNNWGLCPNGVGKLGCGPQETFRSCSDISIY